MFALMSFPLHIFVQYSMALRRSRRKIVIKICLNALSVCLVLILFLPWCPHRSRQAPSKILSLIQPENELTLAATARCGLESDANRPHSSSGLKKKFRASDVHEWDPTRSTISDLSTFLASSARFARIDESRPSLSPRHNPREDLPPPLLHPPPHRRPRLPEAGLGLDVPGLEPGGLDPDTGLVLGQARV